MKWNARINLVSFNDDGHRRSYNEVLSAALAKRGLILAAGASRTNADFFPMLDDNKTAFVKLALLNSIAGRRTVALFFRPMECFLTTKRAYRIKRMLFRFLHFLPNTHILTILPFEIERRFALIATDWIYDPQFWDLEYLTASRSAEDEQRIHELISRSAGGRHVVLAVGALNKIKGFEYFSQIWNENPELRDRYLFVAAGEVAEECSFSAKQFVDAGGLLINRFLSDSELLGSYGAADGIWSCYAPSYNQSSGVFGRAFQFSKPSIVREGSFLPNLAKMLGHPTLTLPFDDSAAASLRLKDWRPVPVDPIATQERIEQIREHALRVLVQTLHPQEREREHQLQGIA